MKCDGGFKHFILIELFPQMLLMHSCCCICLQMTVQLKTAEDDNTSLQQALMSEIELRMQLEGTVCVTVCVCPFV